MQRLIPPANDHRGEQSNAEQTTATRNPAAFTAHLDGNAGHQPGGVPGSLNSGLCPVAVLLGWKNRQRQFPGSQPYYGEP